MSLSTFASSLADRLDPPDPDVFGPLEYEPTAKQAEFHAATEFDVLYGGAAGGGKTKALLMEGLRCAAKYPRLRVGAFRRSYPELEESLLAELAGVGYAKAIGARWDGTKYNLHLPNGSLIMFRYAKNMQEATRRQGGQYQLLLFDERTLTPPDVVTFICSRLRSGRADVPVLGIRSGSNPGGPGHGAVKAKYVAPTEYGQRVVTDERHRTVRFIPSKLSDNPHVNPEYAADLQALDGEMRAAFLDGDWDRFAGQMFTELKRDRHEVPAFVVPGTWRRYAGVDWGWAAPWHVVWVALDEDGRAFVYRERHGTRVKESDQARAILAAEEGDQVALRYADDAMWAERGEAKPIAQVYAEEGAHITPAGKGPNSRVIGWQRIHSYLADGPACPIHRAQGWETCPRLHFLAGAAPELWRELTALPHNTTGNVEDADTDAEDHGPDALRYLLVNVGQGAVFVIADPDPEEPPAVERPGGWAEVVPDDAIDWATELDRPEGAGGVRIWGG